MPKTGSSPPSNSRSGASRAAHSYVAAPRIMAESIENLQAPVGGKVAVGPRQQGKRQMAKVDDFNYDDEDDDQAPDTLYAAGAEEIARYISDMVGSLAMMARESRLDLLTYLLDMARVEAEMQARQTETPLEDL